MTAADSDDDTFAQGVRLHRESLAVGQVTPEESALLDILVGQRLAREGVPIRQRTLVNRFEKFAAPIGIDDTGEPFALPPWRD